MLNVLCRVPAAAVCWGWHGVVCFANQQLRVVWHTCVCAATRNDPVLGYTTLGSSSSSPATARGPWGVSPAGSSCNQPGCTLHSQKVRWCAADTLRRPQLHRLSRRSAAADTHAYFTCYYAPELHCFPRLLLICLPCCPGLQVRGGTLQIPRWFADAYLGGRSLGLGFGGYYSIIGPGSMGPVLTAVEEPDDDASEAQQLRDAVTLISHAATNDQFERFGWRPRDYWIAAPLDWGKNASSSRGYWAPGDSIEGAAAWIDTGSHHALLFFAELNQGRIAYENAGQGNTITRESTQPHWLLYDPMDLVAVAQGSRQPWQVTGLGDSLCVCVGGDGNLTRLTYVCLHMLSNLLRAVGAFAC